MQDIAERLRERLGPETEIRFAPRLQRLFVRVVAGGTPYWIGVSVPQRPPAEELPTRAIAWTFAGADFLLIARVHVCALSRTPAAPAHGRRRACRPRRGACATSRDRTLGDRALSRGFNAMAANLRQIEQDRAMLLAGVSHDLRTPLARLRLGVENGLLRRAMRTGMVGDIEEMDRIIGQFLDFARSDIATAFETGEDPMPLSRLL